MSPREPSPDGPGDDALDDGYPWEEPTVVHTYREALDTLRPSALVTANEVVDYDGDETYGPDICDGCGESVPADCVCRPYYSGAIAAGWTEEEIMSAIEVVF